MPTPIEQKEIEKFEKLVERLGHKPLYLEPEIEIRTLLLSAMRTTRIEALGKMEGVISNIFTIISRVTVLSKESDLASHAKIYSSVIKTLSEYMAEVTKKYSDIIKELKNKHE